MKAQNYCLVAYRIAVVVDILNPGVADPVLLVLSRRTTHDCSVEAVVWGSISCEDRHQICHHLGLWIACRHCRKHCFEIWTVVKRYHKLYLVGKSIRKKGEMSFEGAT